MADLGYSIEMTRDSTPVTTLLNSVPDRKWRYTDPAGHRHAFKNEDLPTLHWVVTGTYWCDVCRETHDEGEWRCNLCDAVVKPHYRQLGPKTVNVPGLTSYTLRLSDGRTFDLSEDEVLRVEKDGASAVREIAGMRL